MVIGPWVFVSLSYKDLKDGELLENSCSAEGPLNECRDTSFATSSEVEYELAILDESYEVDIVSNSFSTLGSNEGYSEGCGFASLNGSVDAVDGNLLDEVADIFVFVVVVHAVFDGTVNFNTVDGGVPVFEFAFASVAEVTTVEFKSSVSILSTGPSCL